MLYVIGTGIDDEDILQKILDILLFLTELKMVDNADVLLIENVSTLLCVCVIDISWSVGIYLRWNSPEFVWLPWCECSH